MKLKHQNKWTINEADGKVFLPFFVVVMGMGKGEIIKESIVWPFKFFWFK